MTYNFYFYRNDNVDDEDLWLESREPVVRKRRSGSEDMLRKIRKQRGLWTWVVSGGNFLGADTSAPILGC